MTRHDTLRLGFEVVLAWTLCASLAAWGEASATAPRPITVSADEQTRIGVSTQTLATAGPASGPTSTARVLDPGPLIQLDGELSAAAASAAASHAEAVRTAGLYAQDRTASARALEAANAQARADQERLSSAQRRLLLEWGDGIAGLSAQRRAALLNELAHVRAELVRVELPAQLRAPPAGTLISLQGAADSPALQARVLGTLPVADARLQTRGVLAELSQGQATLAVGQMLSAQLPAPASGAGVVLPRAALLRKDSRVWVYVQTAPTAFVRREVAGFHPLANGWFVSSGFAAGDRVVTAGAAALLGVETAAADGD